MSDLIDRDVSAAEPAVELTRRSVPFVVPTATGVEAAAVSRAIAAGQWASGGVHTRAVEAALGDLLGGESVRLTSSGTDALTVAAMTIGLGPGDEVIVPSFAFVSTAVAFAARGARVVFADVRPDTLCMDPSSVERLLTPATKAIVPVHYGGVGAEPDRLRDIADAVGAVLIEDAAHALGATWGGRPLGTIGDLGVLSFDYAKNVQSGEGGAVIIGDIDLERAVQRVLDKGTNRAEFLSGAVDVYDWVGLGGHFRPPDYVAAALASQLEHRAAVQARRDELWARYVEGLASWADLCGARLPLEPAEARSSRHVLWLLLPTAEDRECFTAHMAEAGVAAPSHYTSLARSPAARTHGRDGGTPVSDHAARALARLPLHHALDDDDIAHVIESATAWRPRSVGRKHSP